MERNLNSSFSAGDSSAFSLPETDLPSSFDPLFSDISFQSLLTLNPSVFADYTATGFSSFSFTTDHSHALNGGEGTEESSKVEDQIAEANRMKLMVMVAKNEPYLFQDVVAASDQPSDFFSKCSPDFYDSTTFHRLPQLQSVERQLSESFKRPRFDSLTSSAPNMVECSMVFPNFQSQSQSSTENSLLAVKPRQKNKRSSSMEAPVGTKSGTVIPQSTLARRRRQKLSDKARCLEKLMPWDKSMDQATLFEEACKYVKYLQAQLYALQAMPSDSGSVNQARPIGKNGDGFSDLDRLNRNQVLQVVVNSPAAQTMLYSQGFCVFSMEQLSLLKNVSERRLLIQRMMLDNHSYSKGFLY